MLGFTDPDVVPDTLQIVEVVRFVVRVEGAEQDVDDVLGGQSWNRGGPDVFDDQRSRSEHQPKLGRSAGEPL